MPSDFKDHFTGVGVDRNEIVCIEFPHEVDRLFFRFVNRSGERISGDGPVAALSGELHASGIADVKSKHNGDFLSLLICAFIVIQYREKVNRHFSQK